MSESPPVAGGSGSAVGYGAIIKLPASSTIADMAGDGAKEGFYGASPVGINGRGRGRENKRLQSERRGRGVCGGLRERGLKGRIARQKRLEVKARREWSTIQGGTGATRDRRKEETYRYRTSRVTGQGWQSREACLASIYRALGRPGSSCPGSSPTLGAKGVGGKEEKKRNTERDDHRQPPHKGLEWSL